MKCSEQVKKQMRDYYLKNRTKLDKQKRIYYYKNHAVVMERNRKYFRKNKVKLMNKAHEWNKKRIREIFKLLGNKCNRCGYDNHVALEVHHLDGSKRTNRRSRDYTKLGYDLSKVELICANCHKIEHYGKTKITKE